MESSIVIVGNGPSSKDNAEYFKDIKENFEVARMNFFFLEEKLNYGRNVDYYFWAVNRKPLHDGLRKVVETGIYRFDTFFSCVPLSRMDYTRGKVRNAPFFPEDKIFDHWRMIGQSDPLGRRMMSRPLPTLGVQALAAFAAMGAKRAYLFGLDFYQSADTRYAFDVPKDLANKLGDTHTTPGYEAGAHSLEADLEFLQTIIKEFPDLEIVNHTHFDGMGDMLRGKRPIPPLTINQAPPAAQGSAGPTAVTKAAPASAKPKKPATPEEIAVANQAAIDKLSASVATLQTRLKAAEHKLVQRESTRAELKKFYRLIELLSSDGLPHADVVWVVHEMASFAGVYRPLQAYLEASNLTHHLRPKVINLSDKDRRDVRLVIDHVASRPFRLVLNSVASFSDARVERLISQASQIALYLHETEWTLSGYRQKDPGGYQRFLDCVKKATVLCVSPAQRDYVEAAFAPKATELVYNTVNTILPPETRRLAALNRIARPKDQPLRIGMVGSYQPRKGTVLFGRVAQMSSDTNMQFEWVGKHHEGHIDKKAIHFHGPKPPEETQKFIAGLDVLFLPSQDDPQPLAALEAASRGVKLVCYSGIGTAEWIREIDGCAVFDDYTPASALAALERAITTPLDYETLDAVLRARFDIDVFTQRMKEVIDGMLPTATRPVTLEGTGGNEVAKLQSEARIDALALAPRGQDWVSVLQAVEDLERRRDETKAYPVLARQLLDMGELELADKVIVACVEHNREKASASREAAVYFFETGRPDLALNFATEATLLNPDSMAARQVLKKIEKQLQKTAAE